MASRGKREIEKRQKRSDVPRSSEKAGQSRPFLQTTSTWEGRQGLERVARPIASALKMRNGEPRREEEREWSEEWSQALSESREEGEE